jgi:hypothetical protein
MQPKHLLLVSLVTCTALALGAPRVVSSPAVHSTASGIPVRETIEGGNVTVKVTPMVLMLGKPLEFEIAMETHSADLTNDMLKTVVLHDEAGRAYLPMAWNQSSSDGHSREGKLTFATLSTNSKSMLLVLSNIGGVAERVFVWHVA